MNSPRFIATLALLASGSWEGAALAQTPAPAPAPGPAPAAAIAPAPAATEAVKGRPIDQHTAVARALAANPSYAGARLGVAQARQDLLAEEGRYPYVFQAGTGLTHTGSPGGSQRTYDASAALSRTFPFGTTAEVRVLGQRYENDRAFTSNTPSITNAGDGYTAGARATVTQPLLRGAGRSVGEIGLRTARESRTLAEQAQRRSESELVRDVLLAYWELWYAEESARIERAALGLAREQEQQALQQRQAGALAPADVFVFSTRVASLEETMVRTLAARDERSRELSRLMGLGAEQAPDLSASDTPEPGPLPTSGDVAAALRSGSVELAELESQIKLARTRAEVAGDAGRPRLDLEGYFETQGQAENVGGAVRGAGELDYWTVHVGAIFELPLDSTKRNAEKESALLSIRIAEQNLKAARDRLSADAVNTVAQARAAEERVRLSTRTVAVAEQAHEAARARFELGGGIAIQVQQAEEDLRRARLSLARTRVELVQAEIVVRHLANTLASEYVRAPG
ncbi:MAG TPA: TolC family protein [Polyangiaceae bacterium]